VTTEPRMRTDCARLLLEAALLISLESALPCCQRPDRTDVQPSPSAGAPSPITIHVPDKLTGVPTGRTDALGRPERAACVTCHTVRSPEAMPKTMRDLDEFHQGLRFEHGPLSCSSCHVLGAQDTLHKADGTTIPMNQAIQLCAQCHGSQFRDYRHLAHGGMNGSWDLRRGGRVRNHCVDCHDPHVPRFQPSTPVLPPHDRGAEAQRRHGARGAGHDENAGARNAPAPRVSQ
jgi:hypothetical protein